MIPDRDGRIVILCDEHGFENCASCNEDRYAMYCSAGDSGQVECEKPQLQAKVAELERERDDARGIVVELRNDKAALKSKVSFLQLGLDSKNGPVMSEQAATIERLTGIIQAARKHKLLILHDAECFSIDGSKPRVCGREELRAILDAGDMHASSAITMMAINERLTKALCMLYDKYEDGPPCTEDGDEFGSPLGNCVQLTADEEDEILALIPASRDAAFSKQEPK